MRHAYWLLAAAVAQLACSHVVEVLHGAGEVGGAPNQAGAPQDGGRASFGGQAGTSASASGEAGEEAAGGARPADPGLGIFVDSGDSHSCAARYGILYCWGAGADGRLGLGDSMDRNVPVRVGREADWLRVATGASHTCALKTDGSVWCFGDGSQGQLGQGNLDSSNVPLRVSLPGKAAHLSSAARTACAVLETGELYCWGYNWEGGIGLNDQHPGQNQLTPIRSGAQSDWLSSGTGDGHTCGIRANGLLFCWGRNSSANLGLGETTDQQRRVATQVGTEQDWLSVVSGQDGSCGLRAGGNLFCWGGNAYGNLGLGDTVSRRVPTELVVPGEPTRTWAQVAIDTFHACGIDADQALYCWGRGIEGQRGSSDNEERLVPEPVGANFVQVAVGRMSSCAVTRDDAVLCTGENSAGQLGLGDNARRNTFTELSFP